jgi:hypothetical protein
MPDQSPVFGQFTQTQGNAGGSTTAATMSRDESMVNGGPGMLFLRERLRLFQVVRLRGWAHYDARSAEQRRNHVSIAEHE